MFLLLRNVQPISNCYFKLCWCAHGVYCHCLFMLTGISSFLRNSLSSIITDVLKHATVPGYSKDIETHPYQLTGKFSVCVCYCSYTPCVMSRDCLGNIHLCVSPVTQKRLYSILNWDTSIILVSRLLIYIHCLVAAELVFAICEGWWTQLFSVYFWHEHLMLHGGLILSLLCSVLGILCVRTWLVCSIRVFGIF